MQNQLNNRNGSLIAQMCNAQKSLIAQEDLMRTAEDHKKHLKDQFNSLLAVIKKHPGWEESERIMQEKDDDALIIHYHRLCTLINYYYDPVEKNQGADTKSQDNKVTVLDLASDYLQLNRNWLTLSPNTVYVGQMSMLNQMPINQCLDTIIDYYAGTGNRYLSRKVWSDMDKMFNGVMPFQAGVKVLHDAYDAEKWQESVFIVDYCLSRIVSGLLRQFSGLGEIPNNPMAMMLQPQGYHGGFYSGPGMHNGNGFDLNQEAPKATW